MTTLTEFLLARIAEDERHARKLAETDRRPVLSLAITVNHPERLLLECEAKRRIVEIHATDRYNLSCDVCSAEDWMSDGDGGEMLGRGSESYPCPTLRVLAAVYSDHPDYDTMWRLDSTTSTAG